MDYLSRFKEVHGDKYDYSKVDYTNCMSKVIIICPDHGEFLQAPVKHWSGQRCPYCAGNVKLSLEEFINKAVIKHNNKYDYSKVEYHNCDTNVDIICPEHGLFKQTPYSHLLGHGCQKCGKEIAPVNRREYDIKSFIKNAENIHGDKYDYSMVNFINMSTKVAIICKKHGVFYQRPQEHINRKQGCKECGIDLAINGITHDFGSFTNESNTRHYNKYDYSKVNYKGYLIPVEIICPKHGSFWQTPRDHINWCGCQKCGLECNQSKAHKEICRLLDGFKITYNVNDRETIKPYEIDVYCPDNNIAIEYNGSYWHSFNNLETMKDKLRHSLKADLCHNSGITLLQIFEHDWVNKKRIWKSIIKAKFGLITNRIFARSCDVKKVCYSDFSGFCNVNHLYGSVPTKVRYGLYYNDELVCIIGLNRHHKYEWEISRLASKINHVVVGGASRLFKKFLSDHCPGTVMTYADRCYSDGLVYSNLGFVIDGVTKPNYKYLKNTVLFSRQQFQKHKLRKKLDNYDSSLTEADNMFNNGYRRIWDAGHIRLVWIANDQGLKIKNLINKNIKGQRNAFICVE